LPAAELDRLFEALRADGRTVIGPSVRDGAIVHQRLQSSQELPAGVGDEQAPGRYRLRQRDDGAYFGWAVGPGSPKRHLFPPEVRLWKASRSDDGGFKVEAQAPPAQPVALFGVRPCELAAIRIQDRVLLEDAYEDPVYRARRDASLVIVVHCGAPAGTCFCVSMNSGPRAREDAGYDLALTEVLDEGHWFLVESGSAAGQALVDGLGLTEASADQQAAAQVVTDTAAGNMGRRLETAGLAEALQAQPDHPRWDEVAERCMTCANCTLSCPTCFCSDVDDVNDLSGDHAERWRRWDSCFSIEYSHVHGGSVRTSTKARYRQWLTHKLSTWHDQFGTSGCVGCGRCVTWCPVGIDLTEEASAIRASHQGEPS
jgi:ferredoxin